MPAIRAESSLERGSNALAEGRWHAACIAFKQALNESETATAHEGLSWAALSLNDGDTVIRSRQAAYRLFRQADDNLGAARMAMWLGKDYEDFRGEMAVARGWRQRARRLLERQPTAPEHGWLPILECWAALQLGEDPKAVRRCATEAMAVARQCGDMDIEILALAMEGLALVGEGCVDDGMTRIDEAAAAVLGGELQHEIWALAVFCFLIYACKRVRDFGRATRWCDMMREAADRMEHTGSQGICRVHYGAVLVYRGEWADAEAALFQAADYFEASWPPHTAEAFVRLADLRRRQGRIEEANDLLRRVEWHPLAALTLAEAALDAGRLQDGEEQIERFLRQIPEDNRLERAAGLELQVRISALAGKSSCAEEALAELEAVADTVATPPLRGSLCFSRAVLASTSGDLDRARACFQDAVDLFEQSGTPYESARARLELAGILVSLDRLERAREEAETARQTLANLGAGLSLPRAEALLSEIDQRLAGEDDSSSSPDLTPRQIEILRLVSQGMSDREVAAALGISEHTVHRHISNILTRLDAPTRAAAAAHAASRNLI